MEKELRPYQKAIVSDVLNSDRDDIICLPTGAGKTVVANGIMEGLPGKCIFIVPRLELIAQSKNEFGENTDVVWSDKTEITGKKVIIASKDSLRMQMNRIDFDEDEKVTLIYDEAHVGIKQTHSLTEAFRKKCKNLRVLGLTATPERMDGNALLKGSDVIHKYGVFDDVMQKETVASLTEKGYLAPLRYFARPIEGITKIRPTNAAGEELTGEQMTKIMNEYNIWGDLVGCYEKYGLGRPAVGFTVTVEMARAVCELFHKAGYDFRVIHGEMKVSERKDLIDALSSGKIHGLVNAALLTYGFDCPAVSYAFSVRHIKSRPLWFQMVGRILRTFDGKPDAIFVDHGDSISEFSEPANPLPILAPVMDWRVDGEDKTQKQLRKKAMKQAQETMSIIQDLAPMPGDMVEITTENIYERLVKLILHLKKENKHLMDEMKSIKSQNSEIKNNLDFVSDIASKALSSLEQANQTIAEKEKELATKTKTIDKDKTFEYVRANYCRTRGMFERYFPDDMAKQHEATCNHILKDEEHLDFYFDRTTIVKSFGYWETHYTPRYTSQAQLESNGGVSYVYKN